jgi:plastocyanin
MRARRPLLLGTALALAAAAPAGAATVEIKGDNTNRLAPVWAPANVSIQPGDTVVWTWPADPDLPHNVLSNDAGWSYRSVDGATRGEFTFPSAGTYAYVCEVHPGPMSGVVTVGDAAPPPPGQQPLPSDMPEPGPLETGGLDETDPSVTGLRLRRARGGARISLRVSERARVTVRLKRGGKTVGTRHATGAGRLRVTFGAKALRAGRYHVEVEARDLAGNASRLRRARLTVG